MVSKRRMKISDSQKISAVTKTLKLLDIALHDSKYQFSPELLTKDLPDSQMMKRLVSYQFISPSKEAGEVLLVKIDLGVRLCRDEDQNEESNILVEIEAGFVASYSITNKIDEDSYKLFAEFNSVHNVWPFWRQHVYDIVQRGRLPVIDIPLLAGIPKEQAQE